MVTILFHEDDPARVEVFRDNASQGMLVSLDVRVNCRIRRRHDIVELITPESPTSQTEKKYEGGRLFQITEEDANEL